MKKILIIIVGIIITTCVVSCTETYYTTKRVSYEDEVRAKWKGATRRQVIQEFGPPNYEESDGADGTILIYNIEHRSTDATLNRQGYIWIYLNSNGICTNLKSDQFYRVEQEKHTYVEKGKTTGVILSIALVVLGLGIPLIGMAVTK